MQETKRTPLYENHVRLGGKMVEFGGWMLPVQYSTILAEHQAVREACGLFDVSHMGEITVGGEGALRFLNRLCTNDFTSMEAGSCRYSPMCCPDGGTVDDLIVYKLAEEEYLVIVNAANTEKDFAWLRGHVDGDEVRLENCSEKVAQLALQGPKYREVLEKLSVRGVLPEKHYTFARDISLAGINCLVSRTGYTGEPGVEIYLSPSEAGRLFDLLVEAGAVPCGLGARDILRFECCMPLYGHELSEKITPLECGLKAFVKMDKPDFIGKTALAAPRKRRRVGLELLDKGIARERCPVYNERGEVVGETTSGGPAPSLGKNMAMAIVSLEAAEGQAFFVEVRGKRLRAQRASMPFYKSPNR